jgi:hypothetical protein
MYLVDKIKELKDYEVTENIYTEEAIYHVTIRHKGELIFSDAISYCKKRDKLKIAKDKMNINIKDKITNLLTNLILNDNE